MPETGRWGAQSTERMGGLLGAERGRRGARRAGWGKARKTHLKDRQSGQGAGGEMRWTGLLGNEDPGWRACSRGNATVLYQGRAAAQLPAAVHGARLAILKCRTNHPIRWRRASATHQGSCAGLDVCSIVCQKTQPKQWQAHVSHRSFRTYHVAVPSSIIEACLRQAVPLRRSAAISSQTTSALVLRSAATLRHEGAPY
jgi:hypothetical protein